MSLAFGQMVTVPVPGGLDGVVAGDSSRQRHLHLVTTHLFNHRVLILLEDGSGGFVVRCTVSAGLQPAFLVLGDVNRGGRLDRVTADHAGPSPSVLRGQ